jgi:hypothetical protein
MKYLKSILTNHNIDEAHPGKLESFESRDGFTILEEEEFRSMQRYFEEFPIYKDLIPVMTDGNSNYWCLYIDGPLKNMVCYLNHEEPSLEPRFKNLSSLIDTINKHPESYDIDDFDAAFFDYPTRQLIQSHFENAIIERLRAGLKANANDDDLRMQTAFAIMALTSPTEIESSIYPFLDDEDMYIQERAIQMLGFHKYRPAVSKLNALATSAQHNGKAAAKMALKTIKAL